MSTDNERLVSIITPSYNASKYIRETIQSVKNQTYSHFEMIIVDDCSKDETRDIIRSEMENDKRIRLIELADNSGPAAARNYAINLANGDYLAFLDSDDLWHPDKLKKQVQFMEDGGFAFSYTNYRMMNENGEKTDAVVNVPAKTSYEGLLKNTMIATLTVMIDKRKTGAVQMDLYRDCSEDYGLWLSILANGIEAHGLREELAFYRKCENSLSSNKLKSAVKTWNTYRKIRNINRFSAMWYFANYSINAFKKHAKTY
ncbi:glycosyltransferase family 2 protein [Peribacillus frigoritolerans]|uniref:glycosyltransferase family 2 protein n=1 Tax=Peribacillus frigoritolerans TaxID=450367 RepID=UPI00105A71A5|nr:glycosyltransferase family 2 protein [Peribacillus frigoritolerans]TDL77885.1 glycosyltransferase family 2 protein [Peribacillus frigoritolerans]